MTEQMRRVDDLRLVVRALEGPAQYDPERVMRLVGQVILDKIDADADIEGLTYSQMIRQSNSTGVAVRAERKKCLAEIRRFIEHFSDRGNTAAADALKLVEGSIKDWLG